MLSQRRAFPLRLHKRPEDTPYGPQRCKEVEHGRPAGKPDQRPADHQPDCSTHVQAAEHRGDRTCALSPAVCNRQT